MFCQPDRVTSGWSNTIIGRYSFYNSSHKTLPMSDLQTESEQKTWDTPQQARKVTLPNQATEKPITLKPKPTNSSAVTIPWPDVGRKGQNEQYMQYKYTMQNFVDFFIFHYIQQSSKKVQRMCIHPWYMKLYWRQYTPLSLTPLWDYRNRGEKWHPNWNSNSQHLVAESSTLTTWPRH